MTKAIDAASAKAMILRNIAADVYKSRQELTQHIATLGLSQTRNGNDYVGVMASDGKRFRVYLKGDLVKDGSSPKTNTVRKRKGELKIKYAWDTVQDNIGGFAVYVIAAVTAEGEVAAYVGSTANLERRLAQHIERNQHMKTSFELKQWALKNNATLFAKQVAAAPSRSLACFIEGLITDSLVKEGWHLPGVLRWLAYRRRVEKIHSAFGTRVIAWKVPDVRQVKRWPVLAEVE